MARQLILGSNSPRRKEILQLTGYQFKVVVSEENENVDPSMDVHDVPEALAIQKAEHILPHLDETYFVLVTADTIVILDNEIIGKPGNKQEAIEILKRLSSRTHEVVTGVCLCNHELSISFSDVTKVHFSELTSIEIETYIQHYEVMDKAGAYAIQEGIGLSGIHAIEGSFYNVMGLPVHKVYQALNNLNVFPVHIS